MSEQLKKQLKKWKKEKNQSEKREAQLKRERASQREIEELMGIHRPTYKKCKGSWRQH